MPDDPATERDVMRIGCETSQQTRQPGLGRQRVVIKECHDRRLSAVKPGIAGACYAEPTGQQNCFIGLLVANPVITAAAVKNHDDLGLKQWMLS